METTWRYSDLYLNVSHQIEPFAYNHLVRKLDFVVKTISDKEFKKKHNAVDDCYKL